MARYRKIDPRIWNDEKFRKLTADGQRLWFYILTGPNTNRIGLYLFSIPQAADDLGLRTNSVRKLLTEIEQLGMALYDASTRLLWVPRWLSYNEPSGLNQILGLCEDLQEFLPHEFARCLNLLIHARIETSGHNKAPLNKKQAILIRDGCRCSYCEKELTWDDFECDHVIPKARESGTRDRYDSLVASCKECNQRKGTKTAEEFGHPFVCGREYSIGEAFLELIFNPVVRESFKVACDGLPPLLRDIANLDPILRRLNGVRTASERRSKSVATQEQEQEQEQEQDKSSSNNRDELHKEESPQAAAAEDPTFAKLLRFEKPADPDTPSDEVLVSAIIEAAQTHLPDERVTIHQAERLIPAFQAEFSPGELTAAIDIVFNRLGTEGNAKFPLNYLHGLIRDRGLREYAFRSRIDKRRLRGSVDPDGFPLERSDSEEVTPEDAEVYEQIAREVEGQLAGMPLTELMEKRWPLVEKACSTRGVEPHRLAYSRAMVTLQELSRRQKAVSC